MATVSHEAYLTEESEIADVSRLEQETEREAIGTPRTNPPYRRSSLGCIWWKDMSNASRRKILHRKYRTFLRNLIRIGPVVEEKKLFKGKDNTRTDGRTHDEHRTMT
ncbi:hypothetical protein DPMN_158597 [Dreissena polymorpha]|uniref:Uncharacterized protein n=1 Tax=Dreissena polymorpha TaxID=45954 RepID=A0A9D4EJA0_DREPO|nr:hypothetical protein DPMN_158597 [Dreissena polymorpha]